MNNEATKQQIKAVFDQAYEELKTPDKRKEIKRQRQKKSEKVSKRFGL